MIEHRKTLHLRFDSSRAAESVLGGFAAAAVDILSILVQISMYSYGVKRYGVRRKA